MITSLSARQVCEVAGITYRRLDYWDRSGLLSPSISSATGSGSRRRYSHRDALAAAAIGELSREGHALPRSGDLLAAITDLTNDLTGILFVTPDGTTSREIPSSSFYWSLNLDRLAAKVTAAIELVATVEGWATSYAPEMASQH